MTKISNHIYWLSLVVLLGVLLAGLNGLFSTQPINTYLWVTNDNIAVYETFGLPNFGIHRFWADVVGLPICLAMMYGVINISHNPCNEALDEVSYFAFVGMVASLITLVGGLYAGLTLCGLLAVLLLFVVYETKKPFIFLGFLIGGLIGLIGGSVNYLTAVLLVFCLAMGVSVVTLFAYGVYMLVANIIRQIREGDEHQLRLTFCRRDHFLV